jgi:hypothetical protein
VKTNLAGRLLRLLLEAGQAGAAFEVEAAEVELARLVAGIVGEALCERRLAHGVTARPLVDAVQHLQRLGVEAGVLERLHVVGGALLGPVLRRGEDVRRAVPAAEGEAGVVRVAREVRAPLPVDFDREGGHEVGGVSVVAVELRQPAAKWGALLGRAALVGCGALGDDEAGVAQDVPGVLINHVVHAFHRLSSHKTIGATARVRRQNITSFVLTD